MREQHVNNYKFEPSLVEVNLAEHQRKRIHGYVAQIIHSYTADELFWEIAGRETSESTPAYLEGYEIQFGTYAVKGPMVGMNDGEEVDVNYVSYDHEPDHQDCPRLELGPVHKESGKIIITFGGIHFRHQNEENAYFRTYGFIYDPDHPQTSYYCLAAANDTSPKDDELAGALIVTLGDALIHGS